MEVERATKAAVKGLEFYATYSPRMHPDGMYEIHVAPGEGGEVRFGTLARKLVGALAEAKRKAEK